MSTAEAPRWRLTEPHHLAISVLPDGTKVEWEHKETSRESGRAIRRLFPVPMFLEPKDAADHNYPGEIVVAHEGPGTLKADYIFVGPPTPGMEPLNESAQALSDEWRHKWDNPIESLPANGGMTGAESAFMAKMMQAFERIAPAAAEPAPAEVDELKERLARLEAMLASQTKASVEGRRV